MSTEPASTAPGGATASDGHRPALRPPDLRGDLSLAMRLTATLESITDAFFTVDRGCDFTHVDRCAGQRLHVERSPLLGRRLGPVSADAGHARAEGLGLVASRALIDPMNGRLTLDSTPGPGTRVVVELPRATFDGAGVDDAAPPPVGLSRERPPPEPARRRRVLYVEDNDVNAMLFEAAIGTRGGIELRIADDGRSCLRLLADWRPDVLALDAHLPDTDGYALLARLRRLPGLADTPAFMCSAAALPEDIEQARQAGFQGYWTKPVDIARILADIEAVQIADAPPGP